MGNQEQYTHHCRLEHKSNYAKGEVILSMEEHTGRIGVLLYGEAHLSEINEDGEEVVTTVFSVGDSFGEQYSVPLPNSVAHVIADTDCTVCFYNLGKVLTTCTNACDYHFDIIRKIALISMRNSKERAIRLNILGRRTLRDKIMTYLQYQLTYSPKEDEVQLPISLVNLANYLCVDRSAMMREIKKMNQDHLIESNNRNFKILTPRD